MPVAGRGSATLPLLASDPVERAECDVDREDQAEDVRGGFEVLVRAFAVGQTEEHEAAKGIDDVAKGDSPIARTKKAMTAATIVRATFICRQS